MPVLKTIHTAPSGRRSLLRWLAAGVVAPALSACTAPRPPMRIGSNIFPGYEILFLARESGWLNAQDVRLVEMPSSTDVMRGLASGQLEAGNLTLDEMMSARADGVDLRAVMVLDISAGADACIAKSHVTLKNLAGKRIAVEDGAVGAVMLNALLQAAGLQVQQIQKITMTADQSLDMFTKNKADVVVSFEPWTSKLEALGGQRIHDSSMIPGRILDVLAVRKEAMETFDAAIRQAVSAHFSALQYFRDIPAKAAPYMAGRLQTAPEGVLDLFKGLQLPDLAQNRALLRSGGTFDRTALELQRVMLESQLLAQPMALHSLADASFLPV